MKNKNINFHLLKHYFKWRYIGLYAILMSSPKVFSNSMSVHQVQASFQESQEEKISGSITDETGMPIPYATIVVKGTQRFVQSDASGNFTIQAREGETIQMYLPEQPHLS